MVDVYEVTSKQDFPVHLPFFLEFAYIRVASTQKWIEHDLPIEEDERIQEGSMSACFLRILWDLLSLQGGSIMAYIVTK